MEKGFAMSEDPLESRERFFVRRQFFQAFVQLPVEVLAHSIQPAMYQRPTCWSRLFLQMSVLLCAPST
jgi:hypothetical protein